MARKRKPAAVTPPALPPKTEREIAAERELTVELQALTVRLHQRNLNNAVLLAQQAARGHGPLVEHFSELGRRYAELLNQPRKPKLQVVKDEGS